MSIMSAMTYDTPEWACPHVEGKMYTREGALQQVQVEGDVAPFTYYTYHKHTDGTVCRLTRVGQDGKWVLDK